MTQSFDPTPQPPLSPSPLPDDRAIAVQRVQAAVAELTRKMKSGASNFYWIAALSVINSLVLEFGGNSYFVVGLASTLIVDSFFVELANQLDAGIVVKLIGLAISIFIAAIFALFGFFAGKGKRWAFIVGMVLYGLDSLLMLVFGEWLGLLFHGFFLFGLFGGIRALGELQKLLPQQQRQTDFPQNIGT